MKYAQLYSLQFLGILYGLYLLYLMPRTGGYFGDIAGMIILMINGASIIVTTLFYVVLQRMKGPDNGFIRVGLSIASILLAYFLLLFYSQTR